MTITAAALQKKVAVAKLAQSKEAEKWAKKVLPKLEPFLIKEAEDGNSEYIIYDRDMLPNHGQHNALIRAQALGILLGAGFSVEVTVHNYLLKVSWAEAPF